MKDLFMLQPGMAFLNHGSYGACPRQVFEVYQAWQRELEYQPVEFLSRRAPTLLHEARAQLAVYLNTASANLIFVTNATTGINLVARSLKLQAGDEILATDHEYGAIDATWDFVCKKSGAIYVKQSIPLPVTTQQDFVEYLWQGVTEQTRLISISHITSPTALTFPVKEICRRARQAGILTVIDGAHVPGQLPLDLDDLGADFYAGNCHKWLCAPKGSGFLYARPEVQALVEPLVISWGYKYLNPPGFSNYVDWTEWQGTRDISAWLSVPAAIEFQAAHDWTQVRQECHTLLIETRQRWSQLTGLSQICPDGQGWYAQMGALPLPTNTDLVALKRILWEEYQIEVPVYLWQTTAILRVSLQGYNTADDIERLILSLDKTI